MSIVPAAGPSPCDVLLIGEAPGRHEAEQGAPFVGPSGQELRRYLSLCDPPLNLSSFRRTNIIPLYLPHNPDPTLDLIREWTPYLLAEIASCRPKLIVAIGRFAARFFLGQDVEMDIIHGLPHRPAGPILSSLPRGCVILPAFHPAWGLRSEDDPDSLAKAILAQDFRGVGDALHALRKGRLIPVIQDPYDGQEIYLDVTGEELAELIAGDPDDGTDDTIAIDTEGFPGSPWSIQASTLPGTGYTLRCSHPDFHKGITALQRRVDSGTLIVTHQASTPSGCMYDHRMCQEMGLDLSRAHLFDTMYFAFLLRLESQSLKTLAQRWCGMTMADYESLIGDIGKTKQLDYLARVLSLSWPKPEPRTLHLNDGTRKTYRPNPITSTVERIIADYFSGKVNKDGETTDPFKRWKGVDSVLRAMVEAKLGPMPIGTLEDIPLDRAVWYSSRDPDATLRLYHRFRDLRKSMSLQSVCDTGMEVLPVFGEIQTNGMPVSRSHFEALREDLQSDLDRMQRQISYRFYDRKPFNPKSSRQVASLLLRRGLTSGKRTEKGAVSTGKKAIEHLRFKDEAIGLVFEWRERQHLRDMFCNDALNRIPENTLFSTIHGKIKTTRVHTRRPAMEDPNHLAVPVRTELGRKIREGYQFPLDTDEVFGAWDLSQVEMRVLAHDSQSKFLCDRFLSGADIHTETAMRVFDVPREDVESDSGKFKYRLPAKTTNFGLVYGEQGPGLSDQLRTLGLEGWDVKSCDKLQKEIIKLFQIEPYTRRIIAEARRTGLIRDHWGMIRYLPHLSSHDPKLAAEAGRQAIAHRISGTAQGMIQNSMRWLKYEIWRMRDELGGMDDGVLYVRWRLQIHDELILSFPEWAWDIIDPILMTGLTRHCGIRLRVPVLAEGHMAKTWGGLK